MSAGERQPLPLRVLVADDNPVVRAGLAALLGGHADMEVVAEASNGTEAVAAAERAHPDVVLLDVRMPGTDGLTALPQLALLAPVMMLTYSSEPEVVRQALHRGASGYLVHGGFTTEELTEAVRAVGRGARLTAQKVQTAKAPHASPPGPEVTDSLGVSYEPNEISSHLQSSMALLRQTPKARLGHAATLTVHDRNQPDFGLSSREVEVMDLIAAGVNNQQIAATCFISEKTVKNHINRIFAKLHSTTRSEAIARWLGTAREGWE
ncbi:response regulator [Streptomyces turgidiscabies]|uniref:Response regulator receiver domain protein n=1 Tax=Streptomyces turgidiscabies (strain Car8) TaxID=698760 RepID=L7FH02_STRT8|nr:MULTISPECIES: response regulator transcription factor [Streptomyces]ELP69975.1 response regulator receiver domain protein [Streptomyces turgidiscabies Car8]MDX3498019.1 response regulator transcription factor [Streptomyces turgidiscabies]GAQ69928.1 transcriptional regulatory protein DegU [Streptomyces turgidiscabies]